MRNVLPAMELSQPPDQHPAVEGPGADAYPLAYGPVLHLVLQPRAEGVPFDPDSQRTQSE